MPPRSARHSSRPRGYPAARDTDRYYDHRGQYGHFRECHNTADCIFYVKNEATGIEAKIYQGGVHPANDRKFLAEKNINLVVNCTANIDAPAWNLDVLRGDPGPHWIRFEVSGEVMLAHASALASAKPQERPLLRLCSVRSGVCARGRSSCFTVCGRVFACLCRRAFACSAAPAASQSVVECVLACAVECLLARPLQWLRSLWLSVCLLVWSSVCLLGRSSGFAVCGGVCVCASAFVFLKLRQ
jgi:hypothetical protein